MKGKEKVLLNLASDEITGKFYFGELELTVKVPTLFEEAKIPLLRMEIFKRLLKTDEEFSRYFSELKVKEVKVADNNKVEIVEVEPDLNNPNHLDYLFNTFLSDEIKELLYRLAFLDIVVKEIRQEETVLTSKFSELFPFIKANKIHLRDIFDLTTNIFKWIDEGVNVDPFLSKN